jgi:cytochrome oxidase assembly protein ShyY1
MGGVFSACRRHPYLVAWFCLAVVMVAILFVAAKDVGLQPSHMAALACATVLLAGACVWIISWD